MGDRMNVLERRRNVFKKKLFYTIQSVTVKAVMKMW